MKKYIMAIDQGTTSTRAIVFDKMQNCVATAQREVKNYFPEPGYVNMDANEIWLSVLSCIADIFRSSSIKPQEIEAIGISNQRETTIIWDRHTGIPIDYAIVWQSRETSDIIEEYKAMGVEEMVKEKTGLLLDPYFSASKIVCLLRKHPELNRDDLLFGTVDTWLVWNMTGRKVHKTDVTNASRTLLFNINTLDWDDELLKLFDIPRSMLPEISDTSGEIGYVEPYHFFNERPLIGSIVGDQQAALFGQSCFDKGDIKNTYGTGGFILMNTGEDLIMSKNGLLTTVAYKIDNEVKYALEGSIFVSGSLIQWLRDGLGLFENAAETEQMAIEAVSAKGVMIVPSFVGFGAPYWDDEAKGAIFGLTRGVDKKNLVRAALESMAYQTKDLLDLMENESQTTIRELKVDGGASRNNFLLQFQSDILMLDVLRGNSTETTALGAARMAGLASGMYKMDDFKNEVERVFKPMRDKEEVEKLYRRWKLAIEMTRGFKNV